MSSDKNPPKLIRASPATPAVQPGPIPPGEGATYVRPCVHVGHRVCARTGFRSICRCPANPERAPHVRSTDNVHVQFAPGVAVRAGPDRRSADQRPPAAILLGRLRISRALLVN